MDIESSRLSAKHRILAAGPPHSKFHNMNMKRMDRGGGLGGELGSQMYFYADIRRYKCPHQ